MEQTDLLLRAVADALLARGADRLELGRSHRTRLRVLACWQRVSLSAFAGTVLDGRIALTRATAVGSHSEPMGQPVFVYEVTRRGDAQPVCTEENRYHLATGGWCM